MLVYLLVFSVMLKIQTADYEHYWLFLLCGLPVWVFFATSLQSAARSLLENANLIRKVRFPRQLVPLSIVATQLVGFAVMLGIVMALSLAYVPGCARHGLARDSAGGARRRVSLRGSRWPSPPSTRSTAMSSISSPRCCCPGSS